MMTYRIGKLSFFTLTLVVMAVACTKESAPLIPAATIKCDTVTYTKDVAPIVAKECSKSGCHVDPNPAGGVLLSTYDLFKKQAADGRIQARVIDGNPSFMPQGGQLTADQKSIISCWLSNGYKQ